MTMSPVEDPLPLTAFPPPAGRATMRDVAALAGVSLKTVSRVVNAEAGVRDHVRGRVEAALAQLDYRHHRGASDLRRREQRTRAIGVLVQDVANDFSARLLRSLEDATRAHGLLLLAASLDEDAERERSLVAEMVARRVDGLVIMAASPRQDYLVAEQRAGLVTVFVDRPPVGVEADSVCSDSVLGARTAVRHLLDHGHRRIAFLGDLEGIPTAVARRRGWEQELAAAGLGPDPELAATGLRDAAAAQAATARLLAAPDPPTAVFAGRNVLSVGALRAARSAGARTAVVGFDDLEVADLLDPPLTVVRQDVEGLGRTAASLLAARIAGEQGPARHVLLAPVLVPRGSGEVSVSA